MSQPQPFEETVRALLRDTVLDVATGLALDIGWDAARMGMIATEVGISRQRLYAEFGSKQALGEALVMRETGRFLDAVEDALVFAPHDPDATIAVAFETFLAKVIANPVIKLIVAGDGEHGLLSLVTTQGAPVLHEAVSRFSEFIRRSWPTVGTADATSLADVCVRLAISHLSLPGGDPAATAREVSRIISPRLKELL